MKRLYIVLLVMAVALAGCTNNGGQGNGSSDLSVSDVGLQINFMPVTDEFYVEDSSNAVFDVEIENVGEGAATVQRLELFGPSWIGSGSPAFDGSESLRPVQPADDLAGDIRRFTISRSLPSVDERVSYEIGLRTRFEYTSQSRSEIQLLSPEEYRDRTINQQTMSQTQRAAPVSITFDGNTPLEYGSDTTARVPITVRNTQSGEVVGEEVELTVYPEGEGSGSALTNCDGTTVVLFEGEGQIDCTLDSYSMSGFAETVNLIAETTYTYEVERRASIDVVG